MQITPSQALNLALEESRVRQANYLAAIKLGFFGTDRIAIANNLKLYNIEQKPALDKVCDNLISALGQG